MLHSQTKSHSPIGGVVVIVIAVVNVVIVVVVVVVIVVSFCDAESQGFCEHGVALLLFLLLLVHTPCMSPCVYNITHTPCISSCTTPHIPGGWPPHHETVQQR